MRINLVLIVATALFVGALGCMHGPSSGHAPNDRDRDVVKEEELMSCLGLTVKEVVRRMKLDEMFWCDEPPGCLRGMTYSDANGNSVTLYIDHNNPLHRKFNENCVWD